MNAILKDYERKARPVQKETDVVEIFIDIALPQLMKVVSTQYFNSGKVVFDLSVI